jgi:hypothetical protein
MNQFFTNIHELYTQLSLVSASKDELVSKSKELIHSMDWNQFKRSDVVPFIKDLPKHQAYGATSFGKFNCTLLHHKDFSIHISFMDSIPTEIHDHDFLSLNHF